MHGSGHAHCPSTYTCRPVKALNNYTVGCRSSRRPRNRCHRNDYEAVSSISPTRETNPTKDNRQNELCSLWDICSLQLHSRSGANMMQRVCDCSPASWAVVLVRFASRGQDQRSAQLPVAGVCCERSERSEISALGPSSASVGRDENANESQPYVLRASLGALHTLRPFRLCQTASPRRAPRA